MLKIGSSSAAAGAPTQKIKQKKTPRKYKSNPDNYKANKQVNKKNALLQQTQKKKTVNGMLQMGSKDLAW